jgi:hypothetical protein
MKVIRGVVSGAALSAYRSDELLNLVLDVPSLVGIVGIGGAERPDTATPRDVPRIVGRYVDVTVDDRGDIVDLRLVAP